MKIKFKDIFFISLIIGLFLYSFVTIVLYPAIILSQRTEMEEITLIVLGNETVSQKTIVPPLPSFDQNINARMFNYWPKFTMAFLGFGVATPWILVFAQSFSQLLSYGFLPLFFVILANVSIPLTIKFSKGILAWRRFFYVWFIAAQISLNGMVYWENFGR